MPTINNCSNCNNLLINTFMCKMRNSGDFCKDFNKWVKIPGSLEITGEKIKCQWCNHPDGLNKMNQCDHCLQDFADFFDHKKLVEKRINDINKKINRTIEEKDIIDLMIYSCAICSYTYETKAKLKNHIKEHFKI